MAKVWLKYNGSTLIRNGYGVSFNSNPPYAQLGLHLICDDGENVLRIRNMRYRMFDGDGWEHVIAKSTHYDHFDYRSCYHRPRSGPQGGLPGAWFNMTPEQIATISSGSELYQGCDLLNVAIDLRFPPVQFSFDYAIGDGGRYDDLEVYLWGQNPLGGSSVRLGYAKVRLNGLYQNLTLNIQ
jgi:hypothetical protein